MSSSKITKVTARSILDSRGIPTVEARVEAGAAIGVAAVPAGISAGKHEALELRDGDSRWGGLGVSKAVSHVNVEIASVLKGKAVDDQSMVDSVMSDLDGTPGYSRLGANAVLAVSLAAIKAAAAATGNPLWKYLTVTDKTAPVLPVPFCNVIEGGVHADNPLDVQEFMLVPAGFTKFSEALRAAAETFYALEKLLKRRGESVNVGAEGGYTPGRLDHQAVLDMLVAAIKEAGYEPGKQIALALDVAASEFYRDNGYVFEGHPLDPQQLTAQYASWLESYPIVSIEDPLAEDDWQGWQYLASRLSGKVQIVGDDLTVTNLERVNKALEQEILSGVILKPNQAGSYTDAAAVNQVLSAANIARIVSHRGRDTTDTTIADLSVGWATGMIKTGSLSRGERVAKYNRLLEIEQELGSGAVYAGTAARKLWRKYGS